MSEETTAPKAPESSPVLQVGAAVLVIALAVFMVVTLNNVKKQLEVLNKTATGISEASANGNLAGFQIKETVVDGEKVMSFVSKPRDAMEGECGAGSGGSCDTGAACGSCAAPAGGSCPAPAADK
ncbi:MAG: hypothetical protein HN904_29780 [Victivallales bacterium]|nr:hypothetical protein [Victivallales bacterium]